jgi:uncharacterized cupin superfamily protein
MARPVAFAAPADIALDPDPIRADWVIEGSPKARSKYLAGSADRAASVMAWSCTAGRFQWCYKVDEVLHIISGEVFVTDEQGTVRRLGPGDMAFFPAGARSVWHVPHEVRKLAMCRHSMPRPLGFMVRAWNNLIHRVSGFSAGQRTLAGRPVMPAGGVQAASA